MPALDPDAAVRENCGEWPRWVWQTDIAGVPLDDAFAPMD
jgi:hypothetical protein